MSQPMLRGRRTFLRDQVPFLLGRNYERVAPAHVLNGFLCAAFGAGDDPRKVHQLLRNPDLPPEIPSIASSITEDSKSLSKFRQAMGVVLNAENNACMKRTGTVVYLKTALAVTAERVERDGLRTRPLVHGSTAQERLSTLTRIHVGRIPLYDKVADLIVDGGEGTPEQVASAILQLLGEPV